MTKYIPFFAFAFLALSINTSAQDISTLVYDLDKRFEAMHWHEDGRIYSVDYYNGRLYQIHSDGSVETLLSGFSALAGGGFDAEGNFYVAGINTGEMFRLNPDNTITTVASGFSQPVSLLQDTADLDLFYVTEYQGSKVSTFSMSTGTVSSYITSNGLNGPDGIIRDWNGDILVSNWNNHRIHRIDANGEISLFSNLGQSGNMGYITLVGDHVYVPSVSGRQIYRVDMEGNAEVIAGAGTAGSIDGPAEEATFITPNGICHNQAGDSILIGDVHRIRVMTGFNETVGLEDFGQANSFSVSPNPCSEQLILDWEKTNESTAIISYEIFNLNGKLVKDDSVTNLQGQAINIQGLDNGTYILRLTDSSGLSQELKFIKEAGKQ